MKRKRKMWCKSILLFNLLTLSIIFFDKHSLKADFLKKITPNFSCFFDNNFKHVSAFYNLLQFVPLRNFLDNIFTLIWYLRFSVERICFY